MHDIVHVHSPRSTVAFTSGFYQRGQVSSAKSQGGNPIWMAMLCISKGEDPSPPPSENELYTKGIVHVGYLIICFPYKLAQCQTSPTLLYDTAGREKKII